ncbi:MAG TPA: GNAT family N-acetyltransferase [Candidatus Binatia bacterium]|nr:GNAT family N-acetyltransferase [Candidatus Binatia bacterium]
MAEEITVQRLKPEDIAQCETVLRSLPDWFAIEESIRAYVASLSDLPAFVVYSRTGVIGFLAIKEHNPRAAEIHIMAVAPDSHRRGIGRLLLRHVENWLRQRGIIWLHVKTRGSSPPDPFYARTQCFYEALGFDPLFETTAFWGEQDPTLVMIKRL